MADVLFDHMGVPHKISDMARADKLMKLKHKYQGDIWPVVSAVIDTWKETHPKQWKSYLFELEGIIDTRGDPRFGQSKDKSQHLRYTVDMPEPVYYMIRALYSEDELPLNGQAGREFFQAFAKHFPVFAVAQKQ